MSNCKLLFTSTLAVALAAVFSVRASAELVDTNGNAATNTTYLGDIDASKGTLEDLAGYVNNNNTNEYYRADKRDGDSIYGTLWQNYGLISGGTLYRVNLGFPLGATNVNYWLPPSNVDGDGIVNISICSTNEVNKAAVAAVSDSLSQFAATGTVEHATSADSTSYAGEAAMLVGTEQSWTGDDIQTSMSERPTYSGVTNIVDFAITNGIRIGFTDWEFTGDVSAGSKYRIDQSGDEPPFTFTLYDQNDTALASTESLILYPTNLVFEWVDTTSQSTKTIVANRMPIYRYYNGTASEGEVKRLNQKIAVVDDKIEAVSNDVVTVSNRLETIDTSYWHYSITNDTDSVTISNRNQSVTTLISTAPMVSTLHIKIPPEEAMTKDWLVYVFPVTNVVLSLEAATYYVSDETVTNDITSATALYFSQVNPGVYTLGRKEFMAITIPDPAEAAILGALQRNSRRMPSSYRRAATPYIKVTSK